MVWTLLARLAARRRRAATDEEVLTHVHAGQTAGRGMHMSELLRDRMRSRWLRLVRRGESGPRDVGGEEAR